MAKISSTKRSGANNVQVSAARRLWKPNQILEYRPSSMAEIFGNQDLKAFLEARLSQPFQGFPLMVEGPDGVGKSTTLNTYVRLLLCDGELPPGSPVCGNCYSCRAMKVDPSVHLNSLYRFWRLDGATTNQEEINEWKSEFVTEGRRRIVQIDNIQDLSKRKMEHSLLIPLAEAKNTIWLASTTDRYASDRMIRRRFLYRMVPQFDELEKKKFLRSLLAKFGVALVGIEPIKLLIQHGPPPATYVKLMATAVMSNRGRLTEAVVRSFAKSHGFPIP